MRACANEDHRIDIITNGVCDYCEALRRAERAADNEAASFTEGPFKATWVNVVTGEEFYGDENDIEARFS